MDALRPVLDACTAICTEGMNPSERILPSYKRQKTSDLPVKILRSGKYKGRYKVPFGSHIWTCFSSDFFHADADEWREDAWDMIYERSDCSFFMITKRPERIAEHLPRNWGYGWEHVTIAVTCENQEMADKRLPVYLSLPLFHHSVMIEPMLTAVICGHISMVPLI